MHLAKARKSSQTKTCQVTSRQANTQLLRNQLLTCLRATSEIYTLQLISVWTVRRGWTSLLCYTPVPWVCWLWEKNYSGCFYCINTMKQEKEMQRCLKATCFLVLGLLHSRVCRTPAKQSQSTLHWNQSPPLKFSLEVRAFQLSKLLSTVALSLPLPPSPTLLQMGSKAWRLLVFTSPPFSCSPDTIQDTFKRQYKPFLLCPGLTSPVLLERLLKPSALQQAPFLVSGQQITWNSSSMHHAPYMRAPSKVWFLTPEVAMQF